MVSSIKLSWKIRWWLTVHSGGVSVLWSLGSAVTYFTKSRVRLSAQKYTMPHQKPVTSSSCQPMPPTLIASRSQHHTHWWHMAMYMMYILILLTINMCSNNYHTRKYNNSIVPYAAISWARAPLNNGTILTSTCWVGMTVLVPHYFVHNIFSKAVHKWFANHENFGKNAILWYLSVQIQIRKIYRKMRLLLRYLLLCYVENVLSLYKP